MREGFLLLLAQMADWYNEMSFSTSYKRLIWPGYKPDSLVNLVKKMIKEGEIKEDFSGYKITNLGRKVLEDFVPVRRFASLKWDGWWRLIVFDIPESKRVVRNKLRRLLNKYGYGVWQKSIYLSPHPVTKEVNEYLKKNNLDRWVICLECRQVGGMDDKKVAAEVFKVEERLARYWRLVKRGDQLVASGANKTELKEWVDDWQKESLSDPLLPKELDSSGIVKLREELVRLMKKIIDRKVE